MLAKSKQPVLPDDQVKRTITSYCQLVADGLDAMGTAERQQLLRHLIVGIFIETDATVRIKCNIPLESRSGDSSTDRPAFPLAPRPSGVSPLHWEPTTGSIAGTASDCRGPNAGSIAGTASNLHDHNSTGIAHTTIARRSGSHPIAQIDHFRVVNNDDGCGFTFELSVAVPKLQKEHRGSDGRFIRTG